MATDCAPQSAESRLVLVIGYGSTLRGDDGAGPAAAGAIDSMHLDDVQVLIRHQLTPELAEPISRSRQVIFLDAAIDLPNSEVRVRPLQPEAAHQVMVHTSSPGGLLHLARSVFDECPGAWMVEIPAVDMGIGERLSELAERGVEQALRCVLDLLDDLGQPSPARRPASAGLGVLPT